MRNSSFFILFPLVLAITALSGCVTGSGSQKPWTMKKQTSASADKAPGTLIDENAWSGAGNTPVEISQSDSVYYSPYRGDVNYGAPDYDPASQGAQPYSQNGSAVHGQEIALGQGQLGYSTLPTPTAAAVKVAILVPLSGKASHLGQALFNAAQLALFDLKMDGLELLPYDTKGNASGARVAAQQAINDGAQLMIGPLFAESVRAARAVAARKNVSVLGLSTDWTTASDNSYVMGFMPFTQVQRIVAFAAARGYNRIGVIAPDDVYGQAVLNTYLTEATRYGLQTVDILKFKPGSAGLTLQMREFTRYDERRDEKGELLEVQPELPYDAVLMAVGREQAISIANLLTFHDLDPIRVKRLGTGLWDDTTLIGEDNLRGAWFAAPSPDLRRRFMQRYKTLYNERPPRLATLSYDAMALAVVLARHGLQYSNEPSYDRSALTNPNGYSGIDGIFRFHSNGLIERGLAVLEFKHEGIKILEEAPKSFMRSRY